MSIKEAKERRDQINKDMRRMGSIITRIGKLHAKIHDTEAEIKALVAEKAEIEAKYEGGE